MYVRSIRPRLVGALIVTCLVGSTARSAHGQTQPTPGAEHAGHDMASMAREGSGTAWLPDVTPMYAVHMNKGAWQFMVHENLFVQYFHESGDRGTHQAGSINWLMGMASRPIGTGRLALRGMFSLEPWTIRGCGYPDLLATGEQCDGEKIHDRQHPHDLVMEMSASYDAPVKGAIRWQLFGGPAAEPAIGPVAFPHRLSAMPNPLAPITHHWLDATHIAFGVVTGALYGSRWKAEASAFNGREPDEDRTDLDFGALDSASARLSFLPTPNLALQVSAGRLTEAEAADDGGPGTDVTRVTGSATLHRELGAGGIWAATIGWGRNAESGHSSNALLIESSVTLEDRDTWFARFETALKSAHDLDVPGDEDFVVSKIQGGYTRYFGAWNGVKPGVGATVSSGVVPASLVPTYGGRANLGFGVFLTLRPPAMMRAPGATAGAAAHVMVQTAYDPSKLSCSPAIDPKTAAMAMYEGKTYYFCSAGERDEFLKDPAMSLAMMPPKQ